MDRRYIAILDECGKNIGVVFPDFPGCVSSGRTIHDALRNGAEALELHLCGMDEDGETIPEESDLSKVSEWLCECEGKKRLAWIDVNLPASHAIRINITIPENLLHRLDKHLAGKKQSRSAFIASAVGQQLGK